MGESGCGKTTTGRTLLRLYEPTKGRILYDGETLFDSGNVPLYNEDGTPVQGSSTGKDIAQKSPVNMLPVPPQDADDLPGSVCFAEPRMTVGDIVGEPLKSTMFAKKRTEVDEKVFKMLNRVGLNGRTRRTVSHEFSGGQRQRVGIARALVLNPHWSSATSPSRRWMFPFRHRSSICLKICRQYGTSYLFIAHDLSVVKHISDRIGVMYLGKLVELADSYELTFHSVHPYTRSLISAIPVADPKTARESRRIVLEGDVPSPLNPPSGCRFRTRCPYADEQCAAEEPKWREVSGGHYAACHHLDKVK